MAGPVALLGITGSKLMPRLREQLVSLGNPVILGDLDAAHVGGPLTIRQEHVIWGGIDLANASLVLTEHVVYPWPQPQGAFRQQSGGAEMDLEIFIAEREARSLTVSALRILAAGRPVLPAPHQAWLAICPPAALDACAAAGLPVIPWRLGPLAEDATLTMDVVGRDRWQRPAVPSPDQPAVHFPGNEPAAAGPVTEILALDQVPVAARISSDLAAWQRGQTEPAVVVLNCPSSDLAARVARTLGLAYGAFAMINAADPALLWVDVQPDFSAWDDLADGLVLPALTRLLAARAGGSTPA